MHKPQVAALFKRNPVGAPVGNDNAEGPHNMGGAGKQATHSYARLGDKEGPPKKQFGGFSKYLQKPAKGGSSQSYARLGSSGAESKEPERRASTGTHSYASLS